MFKVCSKCKREKSIDEFWRRKGRIDGLRSTCKECDRKYYQNNKEKIAERGRKWSQNNKEKLKKYYKKWREINRKKVQEYRKEYRQKNKNKIREWRIKNKNKINYDRKENRRINPQIRLDHCLSTGIGYSLNNNKNGRHWESLINFTFQDLIQHLEKKFTPEMSWQNYGSYWHIDHYIPKSWFIYTKPEDIGFKMCWDLGNLQPLEKSKNLSKHNCFVG